MIAIELSCLSILALFLAMRTRGAPDGPVVLRRLALMAIAGWVGEETCIRFYGFYGYSPAWSVFIGHVPLMIPLIWPVVIQSAHDLARCLVARRIPLVVGAIILADASLIEPIAVRAGLWSWTAPGLFGVPPVGVLGWAFFAAACVAVFEANDKSATKQAFLRDSLVIVAAPLATHALLIASWWGAMRWLSAEVAEPPVITVAWALSLGLAALALRSRARLRVPRMQMWLRVPAAGFFFVLLGQNSEGALPLVLYAAAFAPPYLALTRSPFEPREPNHKSLPDR